jgi:serine/threonine kinase PknH
MTAFICHSSRDAAAVAALLEHLRAARENVWLDQSLTGGEAWWTRILQEIRSCSVFVVALSNHTLRSKPCRAEMGYAKALGLPILPVQVGEVDSYRIDPIFTVQSVDYRHPDVTAGMALIAALRERAAERSELPDPLPEPPPIPFGYLQRLGTAVDSPEELSPAEQATMLFELRRPCRMRTTTPSAMTSNACSEPCAAAPRPPTASSPTSTRCCALNRPRRAAAHHGTPSLVPRRHRRGRRGRGWTEGPG